MTSKKEVIRTKIWNELPEDDNPFAAKQCFCAGYDVYEDILKKASWVEYLYLLFKLEKPSKIQAKLLETIAIAIANPGIRDHSIRAAMNAGVGGSTSASALMAALAVGAGQYGGAREVYIFIQLLDECGHDLAKWKERIKNPKQDDQIDVWPPIDHVPGFDPNNVSCPSPVKQTLQFLTEIADDDSNLSWLHQNREKLEKYSDAPLSMTAVVATAFKEVGFNHEEAEMLFLLLRLPGAAVHALEQKHHGWRKYPFFGDALKLLKDPGPI